LAENRGRDAKLAETAVTNSVSWTEKEALAAKLIDVVALDLQDLLKKLEGRRIKKLSGEESALQLAGRPVVSHREMTVKERVQYFLLRPEVVGLLLMIAVLGIYVEMTHPGAIFPGVAGAVALLLFFYAAHILPVSVRGLLLIATALLLFILEIKIVSHGLLGIGGVIALTAGALLLFEGPIPELRLPVLLVLPTSLAVGGLMLLIVRYVVRAQRGRIATGTEGMVGEVGVAATDLSPEGKVFVHGEYWNARADETILNGSRVRVRAVDDMRIYVEPEGRRA
jgi:membrane-bound serine protease (ClpP class)